MKILNIKSLQNLEPVVFTYQSQDSFTFKSVTKNYNNGMIINMLNAFNSFKDVSLNNRNILVLTERQSLSGVFDTNNQIFSIGDIPVDVSLQPSDRKNVFVTYESIDKVFKLTTIPSILTITRPTSASKGVYIMFDDKYLCVDEDYPFRVHLKNQSEIRYFNSTRYTFFIESVGEFYTIKNTTNQGVRFLSFDNNNILHVIGCKLGSVVLNNNLFTIKEYTKSSIDIDTVSVNKWVTYYMSNQNREHNFDVEIRRSVDTDNSFLFSAPLRSVLKKTNVVANISNLKNNFTPVGAGVNLNNIVEQDIQETTNNNFVLLNTSIMTVNGIITFTDKGIIT